MSGGTPWSKPELLYLESIAGDMPASVAITTYQNWARRNGYPLRSVMAIEGAVYRHGMSLETTGRWITLGNITCTLGIHSDGPARWVDQGLLVSRLQSGGRKPVRYVHRSDLLAFARQHPERLGGIAVDRLTMLLEDEDLAAAIAEAHPRRPWHRKAVRCVETGQTFATVRAAAAAAWVRRQAITYALRTGGTAGGFHWQEAG